MQMPNGQSNDRSRFWCFTLNRPTIAEEIKLKAYVGSGSIPVADYIIWGEEVGESGTPHFQGYVVFTTRQRLRACKRFLERAHFERRRGSELQAITYCKKDGIWHEKGAIPPSQSGRRTDLEGIRDQITSGVDERTIADQHFGQWVIHRRAFREYRALIQPPKLRPDLRVFVLYGPAGTGKSSYVYSRFSDDLWISSDPVLKWFDGYSGERTALIDDFSGECPYRLLLRILDIYPMRVPVKGSMVAWNPDRIFITSNKDVSEWYGGERDLLPLRRRIRHIQIVNERCGDTFEERFDYLDQVLEE